MFALQGFRLRSPVAGRHYGHLGRPPRLRAGRQLAGGAAAAGGRAHAFVHGRRLRGIAGGWHRGDLGR